ncbi:MAG: hypothetical protein JXM70_30985 [Pirellulales bacterium]|nr:hypothetical protein [Pirellulales bacterium]
MRKFVITLLLSMLVGIAQADKLTLPKAKRAKWLAREGLVMAGSWEPLPFRVRRDGSPGFIPTDEQKAAYRREHSRQMIDRLKQLGVNFIMMHCYKGGGLEMEKQSMAEAADFARRCHEAGLHVGVYAYSGAFLWEPLFKEIPQAKNWVLLDENGKPKTYGRTDYRYYWNRNHQQALEFYKKIVRFAVDDIQTDLVHLDNYERGPGYDSGSIEQFRRYLAKTFTPSQIEQMGLAGADTAMPPKKGDANAFLRRAWQDFSCQWLADSYHEMGRYARSLRGDVLMECNPGGLRSRIHLPVDHARVLEGGEAIWNEGFIGGFENGRLHTGIPTYKLARRMGNMVFRYVQTPMQMAEAMAFNLDCLGCLCWFEYDKISNYPGRHGKPLDPDTAPFVRFYRTRRELFSDTEVVADVAVLRSFPSQMFGPAEFAAATSRCIDKLIAHRACFQIVCDQHLSDLNRYRTLVLAGCGAMSNEQIANVRRYVESGGRLCVTGPLATHNEWMFPREKPALDDLPANRVIRFESPGYLLDAVGRALDRQPSLRFRAKAKPQETVAKVVPGGPLYSDRNQEPSLGLCVELTRCDNRQLVHLVNYRNNDPVTELAVDARIPEGRKVKSVMLAGPNHKQDIELPYIQKDGYVKYVVPRVGIYEVAIVSME